MKTYLKFSIEGEVDEIKTKDTEFNLNNYSDFSYIENIKHNKNNFILLYNKNNNDKKNITFLPFYNKDINGDFLLIFIDSNNNLKSFTENKYLKLLNISKKKIEDYSSDDFNLSDD